MNTHIITIIYINSLSVSSDKVEEVILIHTLEDLNSLVVLCNRLEAAAIVRIVELFLIEGKLIGCLLDYSLVSCDEVGNTLSFTLLVLFYVTISDLLRSYR